MTSQDSKDVLLAIVTIAALIVFGGLALALLQNGGL